MSETDGLSENAARMYRAALASKTPLLRSLADRPAVEELAAAGLVRFVVQPYVNPGCALVVWPQPPVTRLGSPESIREIRDHRGYHP